MGCRKKNKTKEYLHDFYFGKKITDKRKKKFTAHINECEVCRDILFTETDKISYEILNQTQNTIDRRLSGIS